MKDIKELNLAELQALLKGWREPAFHAKQIFSWIYKQGARSFQLMSNIPLQLRAKLRANFYITGVKLTETRKSEDGTLKFLFELKDENFIEAVIIPQGERFTGCISTQAGCKFRCFFCASGISGFKRNLSAGEIIEQVLYLKGVSKLTHIVFMGVGEPLDNYENVMKAIRTINSAEGFNIGARKITISTCGIVEGIKRLAGEALQVELSVSLHAADDNTRSKIMPINKIYPLNKLLSACQEYIRKTNRQVTFEYILIKGVNSDLQNAKNLCKIIKNLKLAKVNLIPANAVREYGIEPPEKGEILLFRDYLKRQGVNVTLRRSRGLDIEAACGQLRLRHEKK